MMNSLIITVESVSDHWSYDGHNVYFQGELAYWRKYDGKNADDVLEEAAQTLGELVRDRLGYPKTAPEIVEEGW